MSDAIELARIVNVGVLILTLVILGARVNKWWCAHWRCLLPAAGTGAIALLISVGTVDALLHLRPGGLGTYTTTVAAVALLMQALTVGMGRVDGHGHGGVMDIQPRRSERAGPSC